MMLSSAATAQQTLRLRQAAMKNPPHQWQRSLSVLLPSTSPSSSTAVRSDRGWNSIQQQRHFFSSQPPNSNLGNIFQHAAQNSNNNTKPGQTLEQYGVDLTKLAKEGKLDPVIGRHEEIRRTLQILARRTKNNPVLVSAVL
jgi:ATP-dependent Clp protease ATP-binding subunit ClpB